VKFKKIYTGFAILLPLILVLATYKALELSIEEWTAPGACPSIGFVPACYLVLGGFATALVGYLISLKYRSSVLFWIGLSIPTLLAVIGTIGQIFGFIECPKTQGGIPMCYISLSLCSFCWLLWFMIQKGRMNQNCGKA